MENNHWWQAEKDTAHKGVFDVLARLSGDTDRRDTIWRRWLSVFMNKWIPGFNGEVPEGEEQWRNAFSPERRLALNPIENCITTLGARIASQRPRASFVVSTEGPNAWDQKIKAEAMEKGVAGEWQRNRFYRDEVKVFQDAGAIGFGAMKHIADTENQRVVIERTPPWELVVDESAAMTTAPRSLYHRMWLTADVIRATFKDRKLPGGSSLHGALEAQIGRDSGRASTAGHVVTEDLVRVVEAWHLPAGPVEGDAVKLLSKEAKGGRRTIVIEGATLLDEAWTHERFPFSFFRWNEPLIGWYPQGLVEQQEPVQQQVNKLLGRIQDAAHLYASMNTYYEDGSLNKKHLKNSTGNLIPWKKGAKPPVVSMPLQLPAALIDLIWQLYGKIFEGTGVSQMSASSIKPAGVESGRGLLVLKDSESGRHALLNEAWDDFHVESARLTVQTAKSLGQNGKSYFSNYVSKGKLERINWGKVLQKKDIYEIQVFPSAMLPHEPVGRIEHAERLMEAGLLEVDQARALVFKGYPDMEQLGSLEGAAYEDIEMQIANMLVRGESQEPMPYQNLELGLRMMTSAYLRGRQQGAPEERLNLVLDWIDLATDLMPDPGAAAPPPPEGPPMEGEIPPGMEPPPGPPGPPPEMTPDGVPPGMEGM